MEKLIFNIREVLDETVSITIIVCSCVGGAILVFNLFGLDPNISLLVMTLIVAFVKCRCFHPADRHASEVGYRFAIAQLKNKLKTTEENASSNKQELEDLRVFVDNIVGQGVEMVEVNADIDDKDFLEIAKLAHENDRTFNEQVNEMLRESVENE